MFLFDKQKRGVKLPTVRDEWGVLRESSNRVTKGTPFLTDQQLADELEVGLPTVITHRRD